MSTQRGGVRLDRSLLYLIYWAINLILAVTNVELTELSYVSGLHLSMELFLNSNVGTAQS